MFGYFTDTEDGSPAAEPDERGETEEEGEDNDGQTQQDEECEEERSETRLDHMQEDDGSVRLLSEPMCFQTSDWSTRCLYIFQNIHHTVYESHQLS